MFAEDYMGAIQYYHDRPIRIISEDEFREEAGRFVLSWFAKQKSEGRFENHLPDQDQAKAIAMINGDILVTARAGSGKTATMINRAYFMIKHCRIHSDRILMLAFNRDAAEEMRKRLHQIIEHDTDIARRHIHFHRNGVVIELHHTYAILNSEAEDDLLDGWIYQAITHPVYAKVINGRIVVGEGDVFPDQTATENRTAERAVIGYDSLSSLTEPVSTPPESVSTASGTFPILPEPINGLTLLAHISQHLEDGLGLRQIVDWVMYVDKQLRDDAWPQFREKTDLLGLTKLAKVTARLGQMYLGLDNNIIWCKGGDDTLATELLEYIFECGNFGQKAPMSNTVTYVLSHGKGLTGFFRNLQKRGEGNWMAYQWHHALKPFCWIYQAGRYASRGLKNGHTLSALGRDWSSSRKRNRLIEALGATQLAVRDKGKKQH